MADQEREKTPSEGQGDEAEMMARLQEEIANLPVADHLVYMLHSLSALTVSRLGLGGDAKDRQDLGQARLAIDAFKAVLSLLEPVRPAGEVAAHRGMLSQLQLAYVGALGKGEAAPEPGEKPAAPSPAAEPEGKEAPVGAEDALVAPKKAAATVKKPPAGAKKTQAGAKKTPTGAKKKPGSAGSARSGS